MLDGGLMQKATETIPAIKLKVWISWIWFPFWREKPKSEINNKLSILIEPELVSLGLAGFISAIHQTKFRMKTNFNSFPDEFQFVWITEFEVWMKAEIKAPSQHAILISVAVWLFVVVDWLIWFIAPKHSQIKSIQQTTATDWNGMVSPFRSPVSKSSVSQSMPLIKTFKFKSFYFRLHW